jgi:SepF-like predicted cell division protein (DUF552 family)
MKTAFFVLIAACSLSCVVTAIATDSDAQSRIKIYESPGNLESRYDIGCIGAHEVENKYTPTDLYKAVSKCANSGMYEEGTFLFAVAGVYGRFDALRVEDKSAHQAVVVASTETLSRLDKDKQTAFMKSLKATLDNPEGLAAVCKEIVRIGPPNYFPRYMIQHGIGSLLKEGAGDGLSKDFNAKAAWEQSLNDYLHCPGI